MKMHEGKPGNAALRSGFKAFRLWRPIPRLRDRWITPGEPPVANWDKQCFVCSPAPAGLTVQGSPLHPSSKTFLDGWNDGNSTLHC